LGAELLSLPLVKGRMSMRALLKALGKKEITSLLVEGGAEVFGSFVSERCFDKLLLFFAPILIGGRQAKGIIEGPGFLRIAKALPLERLTWRRSGGDILVEAYPKK
jgi:diaminohydroxyphosphoribosylaminopyrimidine deaminase/5-amino-6-(5-phosphoribosylamino)uracil reductase